MFDIDPSDEQILNSLKDYYKSELSNGELFFDKSDEFDYLMGGITYSLWGTRVDQLLISFSETDVYSLADGSFYPFAPRIYNLSELRNLHLHLHSFENHKRTVFGLPEGISVLQDLEVLTLYGSDISTLPSDIGELNDLRYLNIGNTLIEELPESLFKLSNLEEIVITRSSVSDETIKSLGHRLPNVNINKSKLYIIIDDKWLWNWYTKNPTRDNI